MPLYPYPIKFPIILHSLIAFGYFWLMGHGRVLPWQGRSGSTQRLGRGAELPVYLSVNFL
jgi:hypothetical protein